MTLPASFLQVPLAHRALHDAKRPENSCAAMRAAIKHGYGIELDVQLSADGRAMVFHDYDLKRLTGVSGPIRQRTAHDLTQLTLLDSDEHIATLREVLDLIAGQVPVLIEIKDQDGAMGPRVGALERAVADDLTGYTGDAAVISFNPHTVAKIAKIAPKVPRGLVSGAFSAQLWPTLPAAIRDRLRDIPDFDAVGANFISHDVRDLASSAVAALKSRGVPVLCWTIRSALAEQEARKLADNITFENYLPATP